jgi:hypothetical protein
MQCLATFRLSTSPLHRHWYSSQQDEMRARPVRTRMAGQVRVRAMQAGQTRRCGARAHTHKHPNTETPAVGSQAACATVLPSGSPDQSSLSTHTTHDARTQH